MHCGDMAQLVSFLTSRMMQYTASNDVFGPLATLKKQQHQGPRHHLVPCRGFNTVGVVTPPLRPRPLGPALRLPTWRACGGA